MYTTESVVYSIESVDRVLNLLIELLNLLIESSIESAMYTTKSVVYSVESAVYSVCRRDGGCNVLCVCTCMIDRIEREVIINKLNQETIRSEISTHFGLETQTQI